MSLRDKVDAWVAAQPRADPGHHRRPGAHPHREPAPGGQREAGAGVPALLGLRLPARPGPGPVRGRRRARDPGAPAVLPHDRREAEGLPGPPDPGGPPAGHRRGPIAGLLRAHGHHAHLRQDLGGLPRPLQRPDQGRADVRPGDPGHEGRHGRRLLGPALPARPGGAPEGGRVRRERGRRGERRGERHDRRPPAQPGHRFRHPGRAFRAGAWASSPSAAATGRLR